MPTATIVSAPSKSSSPTKIQVSSQGIANNNGSSRNSNNSNNSKEMIISSQTSNNEGSPKDMTRQAKLVEVADATTGDVINILNSMRQAEKETRTSRTLIGKLCREGGGSVENYYFRFATSESCRAFERKQEKEQQQKEQQKKEQQKKQQKQQQKKQQKKTQHQQQKVFGTTANQAVATARRSISNNSNSKIPNIKGSGSNTVDIGAVSTNATSVAPMSPIENEPIETTIANVAAAASSNSPDVMNLISSPSNKQKRKVIGPYTKMLTGNKSIASNNKSSPSKSSPSSSSSKKRSIPNHLEQQHQQQQGSTHKIAKISSNLDAKATTNITTKNNNVFSNKVITPTTPTTPNLKTSSNERHGKTFTIIHNKTTDSATTDTDPSTATITTPSANKSQTTSIATKTTTSTTGTKLASTGAAGYTLAKPNNPITAKATRSMDSKDNTVATTTLNNIPNKNNSNDIHTTISKANNSIKSTKSITNNNSNKAPQGHFDITKLKPIKSNASSASTISTKRYIELRCKGLNQPIICFNSLSDASNALSLPRSIIKKIITDKSYNHHDPTFTLHYLSRDAYCTAYLYGTHEQDSKSLSQLQQQQQQEESYERRKKRFRNVYATDLQKIVDATMTTTKEPKPTNEITLASIYKGKTVVDSSSLSVFPVESKDHLLNFDYQGVCILCQENNAQVVLHPCQHCLFCTKCVKNGFCKKFCPVCRTPISSTVEASYLKIVRPRIYSAYSFMD